ncbi:putative GNAT family N-acetyltransferase [Plectosphaerella plurivora]|uniref:GNAT family N-acetyltransferase n=1 Tax=Plectosphaerella plurivora TaxID=936078 RepID=A0A9P9AAQ9_9PEZI|nr:putative GNAT family N-acetyltransferase [Plectosphaerella plurivora]
MTQKVASGAVTYRTHRPGDIGWILQRHGVVYAEEYDLDTHFEALIARILADFLDNYDEARERCWIAERDDEKLGTISVVKDSKDPDAARIRLLLVEPAARGLGVGSTLVRMCVDFAREAGYKRVVLLTQSVLTGAIRLYQAAGFQLIEEGGPVGFSKTSNGRWLTWQLELEEKES